MEMNDGGSTSALTKKVLAGLKGPVVFNGEMSRLSPGLTFKDAVPAEIKASMGMATPQEGKIHDAWVTRRPNSSMK